MDKKLKDKAIKKMIVAFDYNNIYINHSFGVLYHAEEISAIEKGELDIIFLASILHDIGIPECKRKYKSTDGQLQEIEGPPIARKILESLNIDKEIVKEVSTIVGSHHSLGEIDTLNFKIIWDTDWLVNIPDFFDVKDKAKLKVTIDDTFMTETGLKKAREIFLMG